MNYFKLSLNLLIICCILSSCALVDISEKKTVKVVHYTQDTAEGVVHLFMTELDSNNAKGAVVLLANPDGSPLSAERKLELYPEMQRLRRVIKFNPITDVRCDTLSGDKISVNMEIDYFRKYQFITLKINEIWFITDYPMQ